ncbi:MAG TPA: preprotein translocase subunit SecE [Solirubrobacteraceae bacterium]|nr:preprotein translocase subunit SecE [Solirubrobacteraceae bacterium]
MARDRKRAKQRRARRGTAPAQPASAHSAGRSETGRSAGGGQVERADLPGALEHAGDVDEFDAALIRGAGGVPAAPGSALDAERAAELAFGEDALQTGGIPSGEGGGGAPPGAGELERPSGAPLRPGNRAIGFLRASWAELQRVQWPDRRQVFQATAVVLGFVAIAGLYLGLADYVAKEIVEFIL